jgi:AcrR family transcriptional regulator
MTPSERRADRRDRLMEAGIELFGTVGYTNSSVRDVSAAASLNSRYFYESFESREDLLYNIYERIVGEIVSKATEAVEREQTVVDRARAGLRAGWTAVTEDRRKARIVAVEVVGVSDRLEKARREARHALAKLTAEEAVVVAPSGTRFYLDPLLTARSLIGAVVEVLLDWVNGDLDASVDEVVEHFTTLSTIMAYAAVAPGTPLRVTEPDGAR